MSQNQDKPDQSGGRITIKGKVQQPEGPAEFDLPTKAAFIAECRGDAATNYTTAKPAAVTRENISRLAGLRPELHDLVIEYTDPTTKKRHRLQIAKLVFERAPEHWPADIIAQVDELRGLHILMEALLEAKRDPRAIAQLGRWLASRGIPRPALTDTAS